MKLKKTLHEADFCVVGGGMAGLCAVIALGTRFAVAVMDANAQESGLFSCACHASFHYHAEMTSPGA